MTLADNEFWCDVQVLIPHADVGVARRLLAWLDVKHHSKAMHTQKVRVLFRLREDGTIEPAPAHDPG